MRKRDQRPEFLRMMEDASRRKFDLVVCWTLCRFGRSLSVITTAMDELRELEIGVFAMKQGIDTSTTQGRMMMQLFGMFAEMENTLRKERCEAGRIRNRELGKPNGGPRKSAEEREVDNAIKFHLKSGRSQKWIRRLLGVGYDRMRRIQRTMTEKEVKEAARQRMIAESLVKP